MSKTAITSPELAPPVGPFSQAIEVGGFLYFSGQVGQDPATGKVVEGELWPRPSESCTTIAVAALPLGACVEIDLVVKA